LSRKLNFVQVLLSDASLVHWLGARSIACLWTFAGHTWALCSGSTRHTITFRATGWPHRYQGYTD
jgi:hypothetical protein